MKIRKKEHDELDPSILEEKKAEVRTSSSASQTDDDANEGSDYDSDSESSSTSSAETTKVLSSSSRPTTAIQRPGTRSTTTAPLRDPDEENEDPIALVRKAGPDAPTRPVRGRPPSTRPFHNFLAALRPLMRNASAAAVVDRGADLWAAMDSRQRRPFRQAARRARRMRMRRRSGRSVSSTARHVVRHRRRSRRFRTRLRSPYQQTISFVPRLLALPSPSYVQNLRRRGLSVRGSTIQPRGGGRSPRRRRSCPSGLCPNVIYSRSTRSSLRLRQAFRSGGGAVRNRSFARQPRKPRCRSARSRRPRRQLLMQGSGRAVRRLPRSRSRSGAGRRSRSRVRRVRPRQYEPRAAPAASLSVGPAEGTGREGEDDAADKAGNTFGGTTDESVSSKGNAPVAKDAYQ